MSRTTRAFSESGIYHVMFRGSNKQDVFLSNWDYLKFLEILSDVKQIFGFELFAYCLMSNHAHLVIKERESRDISEIMHRILTKYARWFNLKYDRTGVLMENRYKSKPVHDDEYFLQLVRYVHQNPVKAGLVEEISDYKWCSYGDYLSDTDGLTDKTFLTEIISIKEFVDYHNVNSEDRFDLYDGHQSKDNELIFRLKELGIAEPCHLKLLSAEDFEKVIEELGNKFSQRQIARVTGVPRSRFFKDKQ